MTSGALRVRGLLRSHVEGRTLDDAGRVRFWCSPYCASTFASWEGRSIHRAHCLSFQRYANELIADRRSVMIG